MNDEGALQPSSPANGMKNDYDIDAHGYLARAKRCLQKTGLENLFYAALELRCFVEARQDSYVDYQREYVRSIPPAWKIGHQWKALEGVMRGAKIQRVHYGFDDGFEYESYYIPVTQSLRNSAERLSNLIHARTQYRAPDDIWWQETRAEILATYRQAWICGRGNMLSPFLLSPNNSLAGSLSLYWHNDDKEGLKAMEHMRSNKMVTVNVSYPEAAPLNWVPDL